MSLFERFATRAKKQKEILKEMRLFLWVVVWFVDAPSFDGLEEVYIENVEMHTSLWIAIVWLSST